MEWSDKPEQPFGTRLVKLAIDDALRVKYTYKVEWWALPWYVLKFVYGGVTEGITITVITNTQPVGDGLKEDEKPTREEVSKARRRAILSRCH